MENDYDEYLKSSHWQETRKRKLNTTKECEEFGCHKKPRHIHHKSYDNLGYEENYELEGLCPYHHKQREIEKRRFKKLMRTK